MNQRNKTMKTLCVVIVAAASGLQAATLQPGDLLVADPVAKCVIRIDPNTCEQEIVSSEGDFVLPVGVAVSAGGEIFVADADAYGGQGGVIRVDPTTGSQTPVSYGGYFADPNGITFT